ncbi:c-type cytochrome [Ornithinibacillus sp. L9]|uniref:C-type cytochrome n=1 Tax=Ornithinibacillus caprae TaxID=2678566 RepID=A0A6N8FMU4_9BACI|nr:cytochrome c [Ornithinibacillus caprae]MUK89079.1 c-type cytochrome [Ornithinibacillus caprae]
MKKWLFAVLIGSALVLGACGGGDDDATDTNGDGGETTETAAGQEIYEANCAACHGADLSGGAGPNLSAVGSKYSADEIVDIIHNGIGNMQAQNVDNDDAEVLANWLAEKK